MTTGPAARCYYCGDVATVTEHVIPRSILRQYAHLSLDELRQVTVGRKLVVPACKECNYLLGDSMQETINERKNLVKKKLAKRYKKLLRMPNWTREELEEMGPGLAKYIQHCVEEKRWIRARIAY